MISTHLSASLGTLSLVALAPFSFGQVEQATPPPPAAIAEGDVELHHPRLLVRRQDYPLHRANAAKDPWATVAADAIEFAETEVFVASEDEFLMRSQMIDLCEALALAHVLDPRPEFVTKLLETLEHWDHYYLGSPPPGEGVLVRWRQSAMVSSILAFDVLYDDIDPETRELLVRRFDEMILRWWNLLAQDGTSSTPGVVAIWALFKGDLALAKETGALYLERVYNNLTPSGVFDAGPGYAWVRQGSDRISKYVPLDVLEHTGLYPDLFRDGALRTLHEWMYGGSFTPRRTMVYSVRVVPADVSA